MKRSVLILIVLFLTVYGVFSQPRVPVTKPERIDELLKLYNQYGKFSGSVLVAERGRTIYEKGYGYANIEWDIPNDPQTKFRIGSITKQFTSMLIMQLVGEGKINLEGPVTDYVPGYPRARGELITIKHLLTHTSGIPNFTSFPSYPKFKITPTTPEKFLPIFADSLLQFKPGTKYSYSNSGYFLLGYIIEKVTGKPYEEVLKERILEPLNLTNTGYDHQSTIEHDRASGYAKFGLDISNAQYVDMSGPYAAGAMYSTVEDLFQWDQSLYTDKLIPAPLRTKMFTPFLDNYAFGWEVRKMPIGNTTDSILCIQHGGSIDGFVAMICRIPQDKSLIVILSNSSWAPVREIAQNIRAILYEKAYTRPKISVADAILAELKKNGIEKAGSLFKRLKDKETSLYDLNEQEMNGAGYSLLQSKKIEEAIAVFKMNVDAFPASANAYDSLGEAYMNRGDTDLAIENYRKSLELDPNNQNAVEKLRQLRTQ